MPIRLKLLSATAVMLAVATLTFWYSGKAILLSSIREAELVDAHKNIALLSFAIKHDLSFLNELSLRLSSARFESELGGAGDEAEARFASALKFSPNEADVVLLFDRSGRLLFSNAPDIGENTAIEEAIAPLISRIRGMKGRNSADKLSSGIVSLPDVVILVSAREVPADSSDDAAAYVVAGLRFDRPSVASCIACFMRHDTRIKAVPAKAVGRHADFEVAFFEMTAKNTTFMSTSDGSELKTFMLLLDVMSKPALLVRLVSDRPLLAIQDQALGFMTGLVLAIGLIFLFLAWGLQEQSVLFPLSRLMIKIRSIALSGDTSARVGLGGKDEMGRLSIEIDNMLARLDQQEVKLRENEERYRMLVDNVDLGICLISEDLRVQAINRQLAKVFDRPAEEFIGKHCYEVFENRDSACPHCPGLLSLASGRTEEKEAVVAQAGREPAHVRLMAFPLFHSSGKPLGFIEVSEDLTPRKALEAKLSDYRAKLKSIASNQIVTENEARHKLAVELHNMVGEWLCMTKLKIQAAASKKKADEIVGSLEEAIAALDRAIATSREKVFELSPPMMLNLGLFPTIEWLAEHFGREHNLKVMFRDKCEPAPSLSRDLALLLFSAAREFLINVVKHANAEEAVITCWVDDDHFHLSVSDDGPGLDQAEAERIMSERGPARGFGHFSIRKWVELIGGHLKFESAPGRGSTAEIAVPLLALAADDN